MNLNRIREKGNMLKMVSEYLTRTKDSYLPDQNALNVIYGKETLLLDGSWNTFVRPLQNNGVKALEKRIYHYVGTRMFLYSCCAVDRLYHEITARTPWKESECTRQLDISLNRIVDRAKLLEKLLKRLAQDNVKRIYYGEETFTMRNMYEILGVQNGDYRVLTEPDENHASILPCKKLDDLIEEKEYVVLVLPQADDNNAIANLEKMGLKNEKDFFVMPRLLPASKGGYL